MGSFSKGAFFVRSERKVHQNTALNGLKCIANFPVLFCQLVYYDLKERIVATNKFHQRVRFPQFVVPLNGGWCKLVKQTMKNATGVKFSTSGVVDMQQRKTAGRFGKKAIEM